MTDADSPDGLWLTASQQRDWRALVELLAKLPPAFDAQLRRDAGINGFEYQILATLAESPRRTLGLSSLAASSQGSLSRLSHALTRLERVGWVERRTAPDPGGRRIEATLTEPGLAKLQETAPGHVREARRLVVDVLTDDQLSTLGEICRTVTAGMDGDHVRAERADA